MTENPSAYDWARARGEQWLSQLAGWEGTLTPVDAPLSEALRLDRACRIADIGCGGGGATLAISQRAPTGSVVHGFDISPALIDAARARVEPDERDVAFHVADMATASPEQPYERLASRFGIMFFDDPPSAFANIARWLVPGGRFAFAVWGPLAENPWFTQVREEVARVVEIPASDRSAPGPFRYADADELRTLLDGAGFREIVVHDWRGALPIGGGLTGEQAASFALAGFAAFSDLLAKAGGRAAHDARRALSARFSQQETDGVVRLDARVHVFNGVR